MKPWKSYLELYKRQYGNFLLSVVLSIIQSLVIIPIALLIRTIFDDSIPEKDFNKLALLCFIISLLYILNGIITLWTRSISLKTTKKIIRIIRNEITEKIYKLPRQYFTGIDRLKLHSSIVQDTYRIDVMSNGIVAQLLPATLVSTGLLFVLAYLDIVLLAVVLAISPVLFAFGKFTGKVLKRKINEYHKYFEIFSKRVMVLLNIVDLTRIKTNEASEISVQNGIHRAIEKKSYEQAWFGALYRIFHETATSSFGMVVMAFGGYRVINGIMTLGELFSFFTALGLLKKYIVTISSVIPKVIEGNESLKNIFSLLKEEKSLPYSGTDDHDFKGNIRFESVSFGYGTGNVLNGIDISIETGKIYCITGPNGSGKSTIVNLILGFYKPLSGTIYADGISYSITDLKNIRRRIGVVLQDIIIFPGTIRENITYGYPEVEKERLIEILNMSLCNTFIDRLPEGIDTFIGNKREMLSGGEIQRVGIARALLGENKLIILDEPSTHLDQDVVAKIISNIKKSGKDVSVLIISHDRDVIKNGDFVFELIGGRLVISDFLKRETFR